MPERNTECNGEELENDIQQIIGTLNQFPEDAVRKALPRIAAKIQPQEFEEPKPKAGLLIPQVTISPQMASGDAVIMETSIPWWKIAAFIEFVRKYGEDVVYCYTYCWTLHQEINQEFWNCVNDCLEKKGIELTDALKDAIEVILDP